MNLYELTEAAAALNAQLLEDLTDDEWVAARQAFEDTTRDIREKLDGYARVIRSMSAEIDAYKAEEARMAARRRSIEGSVARLREAVETAMRASGEAKVKTSIGTWAFQKNPPSVEVTDEAKIPADYWVEQRPTLDRRAVLDKLKQGEEVPGAALKQGEGLRFR